MNDKCNMKRCKSVSTELGRFMSELSTKAISQPIPSIQDKDIERLGILLDTQQKNCGILPSYSEIINKHYNELKNIYSTARSSRLTQPISDLMERIVSADSNCIYH